MKMLSIVIPAYNEEAGIRDTLLEIKKVLSNLIGYSHEIIVVNNNSTDRTEEVAKKEQVHVVFEKQQGYGYAYKKGLQEVKGDIIITGDADGSYPFYDIPRFLTIMEKGNFDFINTNRFAHLEKGSMSLFNYVGNHLLTLFTNLLYGIKVQDSQSGMIICNRKYLDKVNFDIISNEMALCQELKLYASFLGVNFTVIPIQYRKRIGKVKLKPVIDGVKNLLCLFQFKRKLRRASMLHKRCI